MTNMKKNVTINGINYRLCGNIYIPYSPELPELKGISEYGTLHYLYLRMAHPDQLESLEKAEMLMQYLRGFDRKAKRYLRNRRLSAELPSLDDPNFENEYRKHVLVARNTDSNLISKFILQGVHQDILLKLLNRNGNSCRQEGDGKIMMWNVTLCRQLVFEDAIEAESEEEAVEVAMERNNRDDFNWRRNGPTQVVCVEPAYDGADSFGVLSTGVDALVDAQEWVDDEDSVEWALD